MATDDSLSNISEPVELPLVMVNASNRRIEFYAKMNSDNTFSLIMLAGFDSGDINKDLQQGPFQTREHLSGAVGLIVRQLVQKGYCCLKNSQLQWELQAQRINSQCQGVRNRHSGRYEFSVDDVIF